VRLSSRTYVGPNSYVQEAELRLWGNVKDRQTFICHNPRWNSARIVCRCLAVASPCYFSKWQPLSSEAIPPQQRPYSLVSTVSRSKTSLRLLLILQETDTNQHTPRLIRVAVSLLAASAVSAGGRGSPFPWRRPASPLAQILCLLHFSPAQTSSKAIRHTFEVLRGPHIQSRSRKSPPLDGNRHSPPTDWSNASHS
jgi:hypothetical protein